MNSHCFQVGHIEEVHRVRLQLHICSFRQTSVLDKSGITFFNQHKLHHLYISVPKDPMRKQTLNLKYRRFLSFVQKIKRTQAGKNIVPSLAVNSSTPQCVTLPEEGLLISNKIGKSMSEYAAQ